MDTVTDTITAAERLVPLARQVPLDRLDQLDHLDPDLVLGLMATGAILVALVIRAAAAANIGKPNWRRKAPKRKRSNMK